MTTTPAATPCTWKSGNNPCENCPRRITALYMCKLLQNEASRAGVTPRPKGNVCHYCQKDSDCRPYGPRGEMICFPCMKESPEREASAKEMFGKQVAACGEVAVIDGAEYGVRPLNMRKPT